MIETIKNLLVCYETVNSDYDEITNNYAILKNENNELQKQISELKSNIDKGTTPTFSNSSPQPSSEENHLLTLNNKVVDIEQKMFKSELILQGDKVQEMINNSNSNDSSIKETIAQSLNDLLSNAIIGETLQEIDTTAIIGAQKKTLRI